MIKKVKCRACGSPKVAGYATAYIYCDYCGTYTDWDYQKSISTPGSKMPGPAWRELNEKLMPGMKKALKKHDRERYRSIQKQLFAIHVADCPASYSPRIGDPDYREAIINYMAEQYTIQAFTPGMADLEKNASRAMAALRYDPETGRVFSATFWKMYDAWVKFSWALIEECAKQGLLGTHPDNITGDMGMKINHGILLESWAPYLNDADRDKLMDLGGIRDEYIEMEPGDSEVRHCGGCGGELRAVKGAARMICESCGSLVAVDRPEIRCDGCGNAFSVPAGKSGCSCPRCAAEIRIM
ncbi:MAG: hypothetical protein KA369_01765 [Spirochaetes bacterium]|nr:hypothetical protein [Spirochaetota bacterium]